MKRALIALFLAGCGRSCSLQTGEQTFEKLDGPVKVELVRDTEWQNGPIVSTKSSFVVRVHASKTFDQPTTCTKTDFAENDKMGDLIAFRCHGDPTWMLIRLGHDDRHFFECKTTLAGSKPDFATVGALADDAAAIFDCVTPSGSGFTPLAKETFNALTAELRASGGESAVVRFLADTQHSSFVDEWIAGALALSPTGRVDLESRVCKTLAASASSTLEYERAARICSYDAPGAGNGAMTRVRSLFTLPAPTDPAEFNKRREAIDWWFLIAAHTHARELGEAACAFAAASPAFHDDVVLALAASKVKCASASSLIDGCGAAFECDDHVCTAGEIAPALDKWKSAASPAGNLARSIPKRPSTAQSSLLAAYAQGPLPKDFLLRRARREYAIDQGSGPSCDDRAAFNAKCTCSQSPNKDDLCNVPFDGGAFIADTCAYHADDKHRVIGDVRHVCALKMNACTTDDNCCAGLRCEKSGDANIDHCVD